MEENKKKERGSRPPNPAIVDRSVTSFEPQGSHVDPKKRKGIEAQRVKLPTTSRAVDALIGVEEQNGKWKGTRRKKRGVGPNLDRSVTSYEPQGSHVDPKKRKGIEAQRVKLPTPSRGTDALIGVEEQNGK